MNELIKEPKIIYICFENPKNHTYLVHDGNKNFSIMTKEEVVDNKDGYIFKNEGVKKKMNKFIDKVIPYIFFLLVLALFISMIDFTYKFFTVYFYSIDNLFIKIMYIVTIISSFVTCLLMFYMIILSIKED